MTCWITEENVKFRGKMPLGTVKRQIERYSFLKNYSTINDGRRGSQNK